MKKYVFVALAIVAFSMSSIAQTLIPFQKKDLYGYMNMQGEIKLDAAYIYASPFNEGYAVVAVGNLPCMIDEKGHAIIDTGYYQYIGTFSQGVVSVMDYSFRRHYVDKTGKKVLSLEKDIYDAHAFYNGLARVTKKSDEVAHKFGQDIHTLGYKHTYILKNGSYTSSFMFDDAEDFYDGLARVKVDGKFGLIDTSMHYVAQPVYESMGMFFEGLAVVCRDGKFGYINRLGKEVIAPQWTYAGDFSESLAVFEKDKKVGFIDTLGKEIIPATYSDVKPFGQGFAGVSDGKKWGFIDKSGSVRMNYVYEDLSFFSNGLCPVMLKGKWGAIDLNGKVVIPFEFDFIGTFEDNGIADAIYKDINIYLDIRGNRMPY